MKLTIPFRYVAILKTIPMHTSTTVLAVMGGYLGFWLGLSMYSGVTSVLLHVQRVIARRMKGRLNRARQARTDILQYQSYPTAVMYGQDRMEGIQFPAVTLCMEKGYSFILCSPPSSPRLWRLQSASAA
ncbi:hypothetical protein HPB48_012800 [Haemaphysalis longicornis]|uniref:Uncharacterized protein n=1 Tax=Haemaphysalis longicornis TaxID=44386 RepID=A0A9J6G018_HAELO|nr:hypothetical protein HPB48_012800 [Haemaphysalis longicornis]